MLSSTINNLVLDLKPRQREIIAGRFGLKDGERYTLADLGDKYGITRERVRQIEAEALKGIKERAQKGRLEEILRAILGHLENLGGLRRQDLFLNEARHILGDNNLHHWHLVLLSEIFDEPLYYFDDSDYHPFWYTDEEILGVLKRFVTFAQKLISKKKEDLISNQTFHIYLRQAARAHRLPDLVGLNYLLTSRRFEVSPFGDFGLSHWEEISPKTMGSKAYLVLKRRGQPLHFREVAHAINMVGFYGRRALPQTVHNELIKDPRFVLVGRGRYGLKEQGYVPGTAREIISLSLKKEGPLSLPDVIEAISKQRFLEKNTILLNLQNKKYFKRLADGRYTLKW